MSAITTHPGRPAPAHAPGSRLPRLLRGPAADPWWARPALLTVLVLTALLYTAGLGWLTGNETGSVGSGNGAGPAFGGSAGLGRLFAAEMGGQVSWLLPAALIALAGLAWASRREARASRTRAAVLVWGGWLLVTALVFSFMSGIIHPYYTVALAPAIGALTGIGLVSAWRSRDRAAARITLAAAVAVTAAWASVLLGRTPGWLPWLRVAIAVSGLLAAAGVLALPGLIRFGRGWATDGTWAAARALPWGSTGPGTPALIVAPPLVLALAAGLAGPVAYSIDTAATAHSGAIPSAGPATAQGGPGGGFPGGRNGGVPQKGLPGGTAGRVPAGGFPGGRTGGAPAGGLPGGGRAGGFPGGGLGGNTQVATALTALLRNGAAGYRWAAATVGSESAAPLQLASGKPVMAIGGFNGTDRTPSLAAFQRMVAAHEVHYFVGANRSSFGGGSGPAAQITAWVQAHFTSTTVGGETVYDLTAAR